MGSRGLLHNLVRAWIKVKFHPHVLWLRYARACPPTGQRNSAAGGTIISEQPWKRVVPGPELSGYTKGRRRGRFSLPASPFEFFFSFFWGGIPHIMAMGWVVTARFASADHQ
jgi:hypothetical protein